jgi:Ni/Fe-hydrogenase 1 B-type cytochrome subunit
MSTAGVRPKPAGPVPDAGTRREALVPIYVWEIPVRLTHWLIVLSMVVLAVTGFYIGRPFITVTGPAGENFVMGWMRFIHFIAAIVFTLSVASRIVWMFMGNRYARWSQLIPAARTRWRGLVATLKFYLFTRDRPPEYAGHNPLAGAAYALVFVLYLVMIGTGFALYSAGAHLDSPTRIFSFLIPWFGGLQTARWIHHVGMWLLIGFAVHHVYSALLVDHLEKNATLGSIFSGNKWVREDLLEIEDGYDAEEEGQRAGGEEGEGGNHG